MSAITDYWILQDHPKIDKNTAIAMGVSEEGYDKIIGKLEEQKPEEVITSEDKIILNNPSLFEDIVINELDKQIVGEIATRKAIFLCAQGRLVENCQVASYNLLVNGSAGVGKDYIVSKTLDILPREYYVKKTRISPTVFTYWHNAKFEPDWTWDGKVFYTEDIGEGVLNSEVFKVMASSGSQATIVYKQRAIDIDIKGKPVIITTTATATPNPELTRRFEFCTCDEGIDQTREIMRRHSIYAKKGISTKYDMSYQKAMSFLKRIKVRIPFAESIDKFFPDKNIMMRTKYPRFLDFIKASCAFYQFQRKQDEEGYFIAEGQDYNLAREVIKKLSTNKYMIPLTINQQRIMKFFETETKSYIEKSRGIFDAHAQDILTKMQNIMALKNFVINLNLLASYGLLKSEIKEIGYKQLEFYKLSEHLIMGGEEFDIPKFEDLSL